MSGIGLIILGAVIGATATGGVQAWSARKQRLLDRKVAARVILVDLYLLRGLLQGVSEERQWPLALDIYRPLDTWKEFRASFAAAVTARELVEVDSVFGVLHQLSLAASIGNETVEPAMPTVGGLLKKTVKAQEIAARHATDSEAEREELREVLEAPL